MPVFRTVGSTHQQHKAYLPEQVAGPSWQAPTATRENISRMDPKHKEQVVETCLENEHA